MNLKKREYIKKINIKKLKINEIILFFFLSMIFYLMKINKIRQFKKNLS